MEERGGRHTEAGGRRQPHNAMDVSHFLLNCTQYSHLGQTTFAPLPPHTHFVQSHFLLFYCKLLYIFCTLHCLYTALFTATICDICYILKVNISQCNIVYQILLVSCFPSLKWLHVLSVITISLPFEKS